VRALVAFPGLEVLQNLHPLVVHFPLAFLFTSTGVYLAAWIAHWEDAAWIAFASLMFGVAGAGVAIFTGLRAEESVMIAPSVRSHILVHHERLMIAAAIVSAVLALWAVLDRPFPRRGRLAFLGGMFLMSLILAHGSDYGGWMVYGYNAGGSLPQPIGFSN
jgi:uncharacterized membrane protein